ncbi:putative protein Mb0923 [Fibrisoma limi BUZ 3]|uniref:OmpA/MotB domain protein n=1 Tax=Fibrisoma limi BUZ 3 TaxID=1185876 RepID=I2GDC1_9BACT|nr:PA14 domain-containing protein [Fibrisoma limi]CCH51895.1 putative protein Mb0923 [Fibrisoma limi BUZ 3]
MKPFTLMALLTLLVVSTHAQHGLRGEYYDGPNFNRKVFIRNDKQINFNWRGTSPGRGIGTEFYSIRWTGLLQPPTDATYQFTAEVDDGIRLWVGNRNIIDAWGLHNNVTFTGKVKLKGGGFYDLRIDYYNDILEGEIKLYWQMIGPDNTPVGPKQLIDTQYLIMPPRPKPAVAATPTPKPQPVVATPKTTTPQPTAKKLTPVQPSVAVTSKPTVPASKPTAKPTGKPAVATRPTPTTTVQTDPPAVVKEQPPVTFTKLESEQTLVLQNVMFQQSSYVLLPESYVELNKLVQALRDNPTVQLVISGHTDNVGDPRLNQSLSEYRARVVMNYLIRHGIAEERLEAKGYGCTRPVAGNDTESDRSKNRRVEIQVH